MRKYKNKLKVIHRLHKEKIIRKIRNGLEDEIERLKLHKKWLSDSLKGNLSVSLRSRYTSYMKTIQRSLDTNNVLLREFNKEAVERSSKFHSGDAFHNYIQHLRHFSLFRKEDETLKEYDERTSSSH